MATLSHLKTMQAHLEKTSPMSIHIYLVLDNTNYPVEAFFTKGEAEKYLKHYNRNSKLRLLSILVRHF